MGEDTTKGPASFISEMGVLKRVARATDSGDLLPVDHRPVDPGRVDALHHGEHRADHPDTEGMLRPG
ncbi:hypothetical protein [Streptomyces sp. NBC_01171]|uniref:hypothetical protein n=1 Tax=Streptomyces sp. NBC_01171 TaxID=2903757 RepID=UPI00386D89EB|nr:hypothetical protein OG448_30065 [Streptomyces sp. NBC_01171]